jgi:hypothetical protein
MSYKLDKLRATVADTPTAPFRVPYRLDSRACVKACQQLNLLPAGDPQRIYATGCHIDLKRLDAALDQQQISFSERLRLKHGLTVQGLLPAGRPVGMPVVSDEDKFTLWYNRRH